MTPRWSSILAALLPACALEADDLAGPDSPAVVHLEAVSLSPTRERARQADSYLANYGSWSASELAIAREHDLVILDPNEPGMSRGLIADLQGGGALVLCYISIGEDLRTAPLSDAQIAADARFVGDGTGPRRDPRGPYADGQSLTGLDPLGLPSNGGTGYASWYLDDVSVRNGPGNIGDGFPDRNGRFGGAFVNAGDPAWFDELQHMTLDGPDRLAGLRELLTLGYGRGLGCDGVFLDTFDTPAPNAWTNASSANETKFEWTAPGFAAFVHRLRAAYPDAVILQNRGLFFFNPRHEHYKFVPRGALDFVLYESYRLNSASSGNPDPYHYPDNRYNFAPKLMAEANRPEGFRVLSLGYAEGPADQMSELTLIGGSTLGYDSLVEDIRVTERLAGFRHYLTNSSVTLVNRFVLDHADRSDTGPPAWTSTYNDRDPGYPTPPGEPTPRVGVQQVVAGPGTLTVRWDVALDLNRVGYVLYYQTTPLDFDNLGRATRVELRGEPGAGYEDGVGPGVFANEATITGLTPGQTYYLAIRAVDGAHEDGNEVVRTGVPAGAAGYLGRWSASNGVSSLTYRVHHAGEWTWRRVYIDADRMAGTGFRIGGIGADFLIENTRLYRYTGSGSSWSWSLAARVSLTTGTADGTGFAQWELPQADIGAGYRHTLLLFEVQRPGERATGGVYEHVYTTTDSSSPYLAYYAENDAARIYYHAEVHAPFRWHHVFIDDDNDAATGYRIGGIGAGFLIENGTLYRHAGGGWAWTAVASAHYAVDGAARDWWIERADVGATGGAPVHRVVFQANGDSPSFVAPIYTHRFSP